MLTKKIKQVNIFELSVILFVILITLRPLTYSAGDFLVYIKGSKQILTGAPVYEINFAPFGTRFFNGPVWGYFLSPFTLLPDSLSLVLFRLATLFASYYLVKKAINGFRRNELMYMALFFLWFPFRMNMNLAQGAALSGAAILYSATELKNKEIKFFKLLLCATLITFALNYKPLLATFFIMYLVITKKYKILISFSLLNTLIQLALIKWNNNASYFKWFQLMLERNKRINNGGNSNLVGTWALVAKKFSLTPMIISYASILLCILIFCSFVYLKKFKFNFEISTLFASIGVLLGPYSPAQDSLLLSLILIRSIRKKRDDLLSRFYMASISSFWSLSTEISPTKSIFLIIATSYVIYVLFQSKSLATYHAVLGATLLIITLISRDEHINYDLAGIGSLLSCILLLVTLFRGFPIKNRFNKSQSRFN